MEKDFTNVYCPAAGETELTGGCRYRALIIRYKIRYNFTLLVELLLAKGNSSSRSLASPEEATSSLF